MKYYIRHILQALAVIAVLLSATGCRDDFEYQPGRDITGETTTVSLTADFMPVTVSRLGARSNGSVTNPGDCMADIEDLCLVIFDRDGLYYGHHSIPQYTTADVPRTDGDASNDTIAGEITTKRVSFNATLPIGTYYLYALANMGSDAEGAPATTYDYINSLGLIKGVSTREDFETQRKSWDTSKMANNSGMSGFFTNGQGDSPATRTENGLHGGTVTVSSTGTKLHCWLRRMASKLTVMFDASGLRPDVYVYVRDVRVHNITADCNLFGPNTASKSDDLVPEDDNAQILMFCNEEDAGQSDLSDIHSHYENWPCLTAKNKSMANLTTMFPHLADYTHANNAPSLFFYENMQDKGESKLQDADFNGVVDSPNSTDKNDPHYRDGKPYGTYIEVSAYYVSRNRDRLGNGTIKYRFMLGKNVINDYDTERNYHYKLTLSLLGYANEVDWHIEYDTEREDISIPNPCYISYSSAERLTVPILVYGDLTKAEATIVRNDWEPSIPWTDEKPKGEDVYYEGALDSYYTGVDAGTGQNKVNALGFLSLRKPDYDAVGNHIAGSAFNTPALHEYLWRYWTGDGDTNAGSPKGTQNEKRAALYKRSYSPSSGSHDSDNLLGDGSYTVTRNADPSTKYNTTRLEVPLYTRERNLVKTTGLSGANPYEAYQRRAKVKYHLEFTRGDKTITVDTVISVIQVERIVNPTGVWRRWDNARPFQVKLSQLNGASSLSFHTLESRGSWSAEVEIGSDWILLNGRRTSVTGETGTPIEFEVKPAGLLANANEVRCGVVLVRYHNNTCVHRIFVRQGYAPIAINTDGPVWHTFNLISANREATSPLDEGSMFRFSNLAQPIASSNNVNDKYPWINVVPSDFKDHTNDLLEIVDSVPTKWEKVTSNKFPTLDGDVFDVSGLKVSGRMMTAHDVALLRDNIHNRFRFGVCYGDAATTTEVHIDQVYGYKALDSHGNYGMRGCFVFNTQTGAQIFFPIGSSGYGIRRYARETTDWVNFTVYIRAKYAGSANYFSIPSKSPMFYHLFRSPGAMYWCDRNVSTDISNVSGRDEVDKNAAGLDINYFSYDFNNAQENNFFTDGHWYLGTHACFVRLLDGPVIKYNKADLSK